MRCSTRIIRTNAKHRSSARRVVVVYSNLGSDISHLRVATSKRADQETEWLFVELWQNIFTQYCSEICHFQSLFWPIRSELRVLVLQSYTYTNISSTTNFGARERWKSPNLTNFGAEPSKILTSSRLPSLESIDSCSPNQNQQIWSRQP